MVDPTATGSDANGSEALDVPEGAICLSCDYALRGLCVPRCPECGRGFDPSDPWTMNVGRPVGRVGRFVLRPARWVVWVSYPMAVVVALWSTLLPGTQAALLIVLAGGWAGVLLGMVVHGTMKGAVRRVYRQPAPRPDPDRWLLSRGRKACLIAAGLVAFQVPFRVAFFVSRPSLERHVRHHYAEVPWDTPLPGPHWCGVLPVRMVRVSPTGATLWIIGGGYLRWADVDDGGPVIGDGSWWAEERVAAHWYAARPQY